LARVVCGIIVVKTKAKATNMKNILFIPYPPFSIIV
jgi:formylmethanofuran dehydrogenase subunit D